MWNYFIFSLFLLFLQAESYKIQYNASNYFLDAKDKKNIKILFSDIEKPETHLSLYRVIELPNKLHVLLISDPRTQLSAASMDVGIGYYSDPDDIPGLAHFCEHILFMGSLKASTNINFFSYIKRHNGIYNASTRAEGTSYFFNIPSSYFELALDKFSSFFIAPLFSRSSVERAVHAVQSEFNLYKQSDSLRIQQIEKTLSSVDSPYNKFGIGNFQTLMVNPKNIGKDILEEVKTFYNTYYSSNLMKLVVASSESLDRLQELILKYFSEIPNKDIQRPVFTQKPFTDKTLGMQYWYKSSLNSIKMELTFSIEVQTNFRNTNPSEYFRYLIEHKSSDSLYLYLLEEGWIVSLTTCTENILFDLDFLRITLYLTPKGLAQYEEIIVAIFQYLKMLKDQGPQEWIFHELLRLGDMNFRFSPYIPSYKVISYLSMVMQKARSDYSDLLKFGFITKYSPENIINLLNSLHPDNYLLSISSNNKPSDWNLREHWLESEYKLESLPETLVQRSNNLPANNSFKLPKPNKYIPENYVIRPLSNEKVYKPYLEYTARFFRYWCKQDDTHSSPKTYLFLFFKIPNFSSTPIQKALINIYINILACNISEIKYYTEVAGSQVSIFPHKLGFQLFIFGYTDKLFVLYQDVLDAILEFEPTPFIFNLALKAVKDEIFPSLYDISTYLYTDGYWPSDEILSVLQKALAVGSPPENASLIIENSLKNIFSKQFYNPFYDFDARTSVLEEGNNFIFQLTRVNLEDLNSHIYYSLQIGEANNPKLLVLVNIIHLIISKISFDQLRTKEQLGYFLKVCYSQTLTMINYDIILTSERDPFYLEQRIIVYLYRLAAIIENITDEEFKDYIDSIIHKFSYKYENIFLEANFISSGIYNFDFSTMAIDVLKNLTKDDLKKFFYKYFYPDSPNRKKLSIHIRSGVLEEVSSSDLSLQRLYYYFKCNELEIPFDDLFTLAQSNPKLSNFEKSIQELLVKKYPDTDISIIVAQAFKYLENHYKELKQKALKNYNAVNILDPVVFKNSMKLSSVPPPLLSFEAYKKP
ncbi:hypothetical protein PNEG_01646 [Pneumocystis murina B123]|uniref:Peptidase M16 N-terminal domain-containing protein n=1 Tax=Pneumocystis murina (strain B123) TaxID=1069680 RepID=M7PHF6_PNEMU|nr:hypothetical protein PNEG_01646 [Pneumocystis murina B123]EMR09884.2 hypothetical protein PNEG_01646 [Pneumocystis murina B123]